MSMPSSTAVTTTHSSQAVASSRGQARTGLGRFALDFGSWLAVHLWALLIFKIRAGNGLRLRARRPGAPAFHALAAAHRACQAAGSGPPAPSCDSGQGRGAVSFGFLFAADPVKLKAQLRQQVADPRAELRTPV